MARVDEIELHRGRMHNRQNQMSLDPSITPNLYRTYTEYVDNGLQFRLEHDVEMLNRDFIEPNIDYLSNRTASSADASLIGRHNPYLSLNDSLNQYRSADSSIPVHHAASEQDIPSFERSSHAHYENDVNMVSSRFYYILFIIHLLYWSQLDVFLYIL